MKTRMSNENACYNPEEWRLLGRYAYAQKMEAAGSTETKIDRLTRKLTEQNIRFTFPPQLLFDTFFAPINI